jgi:hypothetical protein
MTALMEKYIAEGRSTPGVKQRNDGETSLMSKEAKATQ